MKFKSWIKLLLKILVSAICLYYISTKIDFGSLFKLINTLNFVWLMVAFFGFIASKIIGAIRLNYYLRNINIQISEKENLKLYGLGMFYNLFLPGGIGGDAYKVIILQKRFQTGYQPISTSVLLDRISGVIGLLALAVLFLFFLPIPITYSFIAFLGFVLGFILYRLIIRKYFEVHHQNINQTDSLGLLVQILQGASIISISFSLYSHQNIASLLLVFYISSLSTLIPISIGGLGAREMIFLFTAKYLAFPQEVAVSMSLLFYLISAFASLFGIYYVFRGDFTKKECEDLS